MDCKFIPYLLLLIFILYLPGSLFSQNPIESGTADTLRSPQKITQPQFNQDSFYAPDKVQHFLVSGVLTVFGTKLLQNDLNFSKSKGRNFSAGFTFSLGVLKELRDSRQKQNHFCWKDLIADMAGIGMGLVLLNQP